MSNSKKIMVCDDDPGIVEVIKIVLTDKKYQVEAVSNAKGILKKILNYQPDLILLDLWMPGMEGKEVLKIIHRDPSSKDIPVIIMSALNDAGEIAKEIGATDYMSKPFDISELIAKVAKYSN